MSAKDLLWGLIIAKYGEEKARELCDSLTSRTDPGLRSRPGGWMNSRRSPGLSARIFGAGCFFRSGSSPPGGQRYAWRRRRLRRPIGAGDNPARARLQLHSHTDARQ
jgi:hypothetical protein